MNSGLSIILYPRSYNKRGDVSLHSVKGMTQDGIEVNVKLRVDARALPFDDVPSIAEFSRVDRRARYACLAADDNSPDASEGVLLFTHAELDVKNRKGIPSYVARWASVLANDSDSMKPIIGPGRFLTGSVGSDSDTPVFEREYGYMVYLPHFQKTFGEIGALDLSSASFDLNGYEDRGFSVGFAVSITSSEGGVFKESYKEVFSSSVSLVFLKGYIDEFASLPGYHESTLVVTPFIYNRFKVEKDSYINSEDQLQNYLLSIVRGTEDGMAYRVVVRDRPNPLHSFFRISDIYGHPSKLSKDGQFSGYFVGEEPPKTQSLPGELPVYLASGIKGFPITRSMWLITDVLTQPDLIVSETNSSVASESTALSDINRVVDTNNAIEIGVIVVPSAIDEEESEPVIAISEPKNDEGHHSVAEKYTDESSVIAALDEDIDSDDRYVSDVGRKSIPVPLSDTGGEASETSLTQPDLIQVKPKLKGMAAYIRRP